MAWVLVATVLLQLGQAVAVWPGLPDGSVHLLMASALLSPILAGGLAVAVVGCAVAPTVRGVRRLARVAAAVVTLAAVFAGFLLVTSPQPTDVGRFVAGRFAELSVFAVAAVVLWAVALPDRRRASSNPPQAPRSVPEPATAEVDSAPVWEPAQTAGVAWRTAAEAAAGAPGSATFSARSDAADELEAGR